MSNHTPHSNSIHNLPRPLPSNTTTPPLPVPSHLANMPTDSHIPPDKFDVPASAPAPPSAYATVAAAHPLMSHAGPSSATLHPAASSSSRPPAHSIPQAMLSNIPISYPYSLPSLNPLNQPPLATSSVPSLHHQPTQQTPDLQSLACLTQPLTNPLTHTLHHPQPHHPDPHAIPSSSIHHHTIPQQIHQQHDPAVHTASANPSTLHAAAAAVAAAAAATPSERHLQQHHRNDDALIQHHPSTIPATTSSHPSTLIHPHQPSPSNHTSPVHQQMPHPYPAPAPQPRQPSPTTSEAADAPSTDGNGPGSTAGAASTVGVPSVDGGGGVSGSSSGNVTDDRAPQNTSTPHNQPDVSPVAAPPSNGRRRSAESDSLSNDRPNKRPHRSISHAEKRRLCEISEEHPAAKHGHIASVFQSETGRRIERSTVTRVLQRKDFWMSAGTRDSNRKRLTSPRFPSIEEALFELIRNRSRVPALRALLTDKELMKFSKDIAEVIRSDSGSTDKNSANYAPHLRSFRGSLSWITSFKKRNALMPPEQHRPFPVRPFVSTSQPSETLDIWQTELNEGEVIESLQDFTRMEDMYFLDAVALATSARPENAAVSSRVTPLNYDQVRVIDEAFGIVEHQNQDREAPNAEASGSAIPQIDFSIPILPSNTPGMSNPLPSTDSANVQGGMPPQTGDNYPSIGPVNPPQPTQNPPEYRHPVGEDTIVYALFCSNGVGNDKRPPWIVGKKALMELGPNGGEVWPGCPVRYFHNKQGWLTGRLARKWLEEFDRTIDRKVIVMTSLLSACDLELMDLKHVAVVAIPRTEPFHEKQAVMSWSSTSASPMHHGIEQMFRAKYRSLVMERALRDMGEQKPLKNLPLKVVATTVKEAWDKVPVPVIRRAWRALSYLPAKFSRNTSRPRSNGDKPMWGQTLLDLDRLLMTYRDLIPMYKYADDIELRQSDVFAAANELSDYIWLPVEESPFHPSGTILDFARCACTDTPTSEDENDSAKVAKEIEKSFQIENHEDALDIINKFAEFVKSDPSLGSDHNLYLVGSLQLQVKKECERRRNEADARNWIETNRQKSRGLP